MAVILQVGSAAACLRKRAPRRRARALGGPPRQAPAAATARARVRRDTRGSREATRAFKACKAQCSCIPPWRASAAGYAPPPPRTEREGVALCLGRLPFCAGLLREPRREVSSPVVCERKGHEHVKRENSLKDRCAPFTMMLGRRSREAGTLEERGCLHGRHRQQHSATVRPRHRLGRARPPQLAELYTRGLRNGERKQDVQRATASGPWYLPPPHSGRPSRLAAAAPFSAGCKLETTAAVGQKAIGRREVHTQVLLAQRPRAHGTYATHSSEPAMLGVAVSPCERGTASSGSQNSRTIHCR